MPARNRRFLRFQKKSKSKSGIYGLFSAKRGWKILLLAAIVFFPIVLALFFVREKYWEPEGKLTVAVQNDSGKVLIYVFDSVEDEITKIIIPGTTEVEAANNLGVWKLGSIWDLGENEKIGGELLAKTLTTHFKFPVFAWSDSSMVKIAEGNAITSLLAAIYPASTNLSYGDRLKVAVFALKTNNIQWEIIELSETLLLKKSTLRDGGEGYVLSGFESATVSSKFSDYSFLQETVRVQIRDGSGKSGSAKAAGEILEVLGTKVSSIVKEEEKDLVCEISGRENIREAIERTALVLGCDTRIENPDNNFDLILLLGKNYL